jgi:hypothetical protein
MRQYLIQFFGGALILLAAAGCSPQQRQDADRAGGRVAQETRNLAQEAREKAADVALAGKVESALRLRQGLDVRRIEVKADARQGNVRLEGSVPSMSQRQLADEVAKTTDGVRRVDNRLAVPPEPVSRKP